MENIINKIYEIIKMFLPNLDETKTKLEIKIQIRKSLNYMNREDFPEKLIEPLAEAMALSYASEIEAGEIKSISEGDTRIEYSTGTTQEDKVAISMREQLNRFRKVGTINVSTSIE